MNLPNKVSSGGKVCASWANSVVDCLRALRPSSSTGIIINWTSNGWSANVKASSTSEIYRPPLTAYWISSSDDSSFVKIIPGLVNQSIPKISEVEITEPTAKLEVPKSTNGKIYIELDNSETATNPKIVFSDSKKENTNVKGYICLADISSGKIFNYLSSSLSTHQCKTELFFWRS